jgi:hypothetical protein
MGDCPAAFHGSGECYLVSLGGEEVSVYIAMEGGEK